MKRGMFVLLVTFVLLGAWRVQAVVIDDFTQGSSNLNVTLTDGVAQQTNSGL